MKKLLIVLVFGALTLTAQEIKFTYGYWDFERDNLRLGFDLSSSAGYSLPLNLNNKPANKDLAENYKSVIPNLSIRAGLGVNAEEADKPPLRTTLALEFSHKAFNNDSTDLSLYGFGFSSRNSIHPLKNLSIISGKGSGLYFLKAEPDLEKTETFADYTSDRTARTGKLHLYDTHELGLGVALGNRGNCELSLSGRFDTFFPRYLVWKEFMRGGVYTAIQNGASELAERTEVWPLLLVGDVAIIAMEMFNLNFYPDAVGITHQHIFSPSATLTYRF